MTAGHSLSSQMVSVLFLITAIPTATSRSEYLNESAAVQPSVEKMLIKHLLAKYEAIGKIGRPVQNHSQTLMVAFGLSLFQLMDLDEKKQLLTINVGNRITWRDEILTWDPTQYRGLTSVRIPVKRIWTPDIVLYNYYDLRMREHREVLVTVDFNGLAYWSPPAIYKSICRIEMKYFPFDHQVCYLRFASWTQDGSRLELDFYENIPEASVDEYKKSNELKRNPAFYAYLLVLPCLLLASLNLVTFWLPPQVPARMLLGMNIFVGFCILMKFLTTSTPSASNTIPYLGYYCCLNMVLIAISTFISLIAVNLHFRCNKQNPLPDWLIKALDIATGFLGLRIRPARDADDKNVNKYEMQATRKKLALNMFHNNHQKQPQQLQMQHHPEELAWKQDCHHCRWANTRCCWLAGTDSQMPLSQRHSCLYPQPCSCNVGECCSGTHPCVVETGVCSVHRHCCTHGNRVVSSCTHCRQNRDNSHHAHGENREKSSLLHDICIPPVNSLGSLSRNDVIEGLIVKAGRLEDTPEQNPGQLISHSGVASVQTSAQQLEHNLSEIKRALRNLMNKVVAKDKNAKRASEWAMLALAVDRFCFWAYLVAIMVSGLGMLIPTSYSLQAEDVTKQFDSWKFNT